MFYITHNKGNILLKCLVYLSFLYSIHCYNHILFLLFEYIFIVYFINLHQSSIIKPSPFSHWATKKHLSLWKGQALSAPAVPPNLTLRFTLFIHQHVCFLCNRWSSRQRLLSVRVALISPFHTTCYTVISPSTAL